MPEERSRFFYRCSLRLIACFSAILTVFIALSGLASGAEKRFTFGGEFRFRITSIADIPLEADRNGGSKITESLFTRFRTRLWAKYQINDDNAFKIRLTNEFRHYDHDKVNHNNPWPFPEEFIFDELYLDSHNLLNGDLDIRVGRQFLMYGTGKIFLETSPLDGSRTAFSNALKASLKTGKDKSVDFLYFDNPSEDRLAIHSSDAKLVEWDEHGAAFYRKNSASSKCPFEYYYVYKDEIRDPADGRNVHLNTCGMRVMPVFSKVLSGNIEVAGQKGTQGGATIGGTMVDAFFDWSFRPDDRHKPIFTGGYYYLSGDDTDTAADESWHPVMSRWPQFSEFFLYAFIDGAGGHNVGYWTNLSALWAGVRYVPSSKTSVELKYFNMKAAETDSVTYPSLGDSIGNLITCRFKYKIRPNWFGHLHYEWFSPGDYYVGEISNGHFFRAEIDYRF